MQHVQHSIHVEIRDGLPSSQIHPWGLALLAAVAGAAACCAEASAHPCDALAVLRLLLLLEGLLRLRLLAAPGPVSSSISGSCCI
jgi:hypothetical protein